MRLRSFFAAHYKKMLLFASVALLLSVTGFFILPPIVKSIAIKNISEKLQVSSSYRPSCKRACSRSCRAASSRNRRNNF